MAFVESFWGDKNAGFTVLHHNFFKDSYSTSKDLTDYLNQTIKFQQLAFKQLNEISKRIARYNNNGSFSPMWETFRSWVSELSSCHQSLERASQTIVDNIQQYITQQGEKQKTHKDQISSTMDAVQQIQEMTVAVQRAKEAYHQRCIEYEKMKRGEAQNNPKEMQRLEARRKKCCEDYQAYIAKYASARDAFANRMRDSCQLFEEIERQHLKQMGQFTQEFYNVQEKFSRDFAGALSKLKLQCDSYSVDELIRQFVISKGTGHDKPVTPNIETGPIEFEEPDLSTLPGTPVPDPAKEAIFTHAYKFLRKKKKDKKGDGVNGGPNDSASSIAVRDTPDNVDDEGFNIRPTNPWSVDNKESSDESEDGWVGTDGDRDPPARLQVTIRDKPLLIDGQLEDPFTMRIPSPNAFNSVGKKQGLTKRAQSVDICHHPENRTRVVHANQKWANFDDDAGFRSGLVALPAPAVGGASRWNGRLPDDDDLSFNQGVTIHKLSAVAFNGDNISHDTLKSVLTTNHSRCSTPSVSASLAGNASPPMSRAAPSVADIAFGGSVNAAAAPSAIDLMTGQLVSPLTDAPAEPDPFAVPTYVRDLVNSGAKSSPLSAVSLLPNRPMMGVSPRSTFTNTSSSGVTSSALDMELSANTSSLAAEERSVATSRGASEADSAAGDAAPAAAWGAGRPVVTPQPPAVRAADEAPEAALFSLAAPPPVPQRSFGQSGRAATPLSAFAAPTPVALTRPVPAQKTAFPGAPLKATSSLAATPTSYSTSPAVPVAAGSSWPAQFDFVPAFTPRAASPGINTNSVGFDTAGSTPSLTVQLQPPVSASPPISSTVIPLAIAFSESINASFHGVDKHKCVVKCTGDVIISFPSKIVQVLLSNPNQTQLVFNVQNAGRMENVQVNRLLVAQDHSKTTDSRLVFGFDMNALTDHLKRQVDQNSRASFFNIDIVKYQIRPIEPQWQTAPLIISTCWRAESPHYDFRLDVQQNDSAVKPTSAVPTAVAIRLPLPPVLMNCVFHSLPEAKKDFGGSFVEWRFNQLPTAGAEPFCLRARFTLSPDTPNPNTTFSPPVALVQFTVDNATLSGAEFQLAGSAYIVSRKCSRITSGVYKAEPDMEVKFV